jgi:hypothetical protein
MKELGDFIESMLDNADTVPEFLKAHPSDYTPQNLLQQAPSQQVMT